MKSILFTILFVFIPKMAVAQYNITTKDDAVYLDSVYKIGTQENHKYIRVVKNYTDPNQKSYLFEDYYKSGKMAMSGTTTNRNKIIETGTFVYYYENGNKKEERDYVKGRVNGKNSLWYENGGKKMEGEYIEDEKKRTATLKINQFWDENNVQKVVDGNGYYDAKGEYEHSKGEVKNGFKDGIWEGSLFNTNCTYKETYLNGILLSGESVDKNGITYTYTEVEIQPKYKTGIADFYQYVGKNYRLPNMPKGMEGKIILAFVVDADGKIVEPKVIQEIGYGTGAEALRMLNSCENWIPARQRGIKVRCSYTLPISIKSSN